MSELTPEQRVCTEILRIMTIYHKQDERGAVDTPGGLEHMGDVWGLFLKWEEMLREKAVTQRQPFRLALAERDARIAELEKALTNMKIEVADCVEELHESVLYPMNEGHMNPVQLDVCLAQLMQAVESMAQHALAPKAAT